MKKLDQKMKEWREFGELSTFVCQKTAAAGLLAVAALLTKDKAT
jgi:hypothetical protein